MKFSSKTSIYIINILFVFFSPLHAQDIISQATSIAKKGLRTNRIELKDKFDHSRYYLVAGSHQYKALWTRDFSTAVPGALLAGEYQAVRDSLEIIFSMQRDDGLLPRGVDTMDMKLRVLVGVLGQSLPFKGKLKAQFKTEYGLETMDANILIPWAASQYVQTSGDSEFAKRYFPSAELAISFLKKKHFVDGLVGNQPPFSDWQDSIKRTGRVAATNVYAILALRGMAKWAEALHLTDLAKKYSKESDQMEIKFRDFFWIPEKAMVRNFEGDDHLAADANLLAIVHHILLPEQSMMAMETLRSSPLWRPMPGRATWPDYPMSLKGKNLKLAGIPTYFDAMYWLWITSLAARAEATVGNCQGYETIMNMLSERIVTDGTVFEVFDLDHDAMILKPVKRPFYRSENPFTWSSGMFLEAALSPLCQSIELNLEP